MASEHSFYRKIGQKLEIELFTALNCFAGAVKTQNLMGAPFLFELVAVVS